MLDYLENDDDIPEIPCDPARMKQVFLNILDNAAKHGGEGGRITAEICREKRRRQDSRRHPHPRLLAPAFPKRSCRL